MTQVQGAIRARQLHNLYTGGQRQAEARVAIAVVLVVVAVVVVVVAVAEPAVTATASRAAVAVISPVQSQWTSNFCWARAHRPEQEPSWGRGGGVGGGVLDQG